MKSKSPTKIKDLVPDDKNFNKGSEYGNSLIEKSFRKFGAGRSILIDKNNRIIAGNKSVENAAAIGMEDLQIVESDGKRIIAVKRMDIDLDTPEGRELALADNATAKANIVFDAELIIAEVGEAVCEEWGVETGKQLEAVEDDFDGVAPKEPITLLGDLYEIGEHRLLCGDSTDSDAVAKLMNGQKADMVFTDPPYGVSYTGGLKNGKNGLEQNGREMIKNDDIDLYEDAVTIASMFCDGPVFMFYADTVPFGLYRGIENVKGQIIALIIWKKEGGYGALGASYKANHEPCVIWKTKGSNLNFIGSTTETRIWEEKKEGKNKLHPTQKPVEIPARAISNHKADKVLDLFLGSGSTMVASHQLNRKCYGMELDCKYCDVIVARMIKLDAALPIKRNGQLLSKDELNKFIENTNAEK